MNKLAKKLYQSAVAAIEEQELPKWEALPQEFRIRFARQLEEGLQNLFKKA
jgi:hypothetical protein